MATRTITRSDIVRTLKDEVGLPKTDCSKLLEDFLTEITDTLVSGERVSIAGFASFFTHQKLGRTGRNPKTLEEVPIPPRRVVVFRPSLILKHKTK